MTFREKLKKAIEPIVLHFLSLCAVVVSIWAFHWVLAFFLGEHAVLFGRVRIDYLAHTGDLAVFLRFIWSALKEFKDV